MKLLPALENILNLIIPTLVSSGDPHSFKEDALDRIEELLLQTLEKKAKNLNPDINRFATTFSVSDKNQLYNNLVIFKQAYLEEKNSEEVKHELSNQDLRTQLRSALSERLEYLLNYRSPFLKQQHQNAIAGLDYFQLPHLRPQSAPAENKNEKPLFPRAKASLKINVANTFSKFDIGIKVGHNIWYMPAGVMEYVKAGLQLPPELVSAVMQGGEMQFDRLTYGGEGGYSIVEIDNIRWVQIIKNSTQEHVYYRIENNTKQHWIGFLCEVRISAGNSYVVNCHGHSGTIPSGNVTIAEFGEPYSEVFQKRLQILMEMALCAKRTKYYHVPASTDNPMFTLAAITELEVEKKKNADINLTCDDGLLAENPPYDRDTSVLESSLHNYNQAQLQFICEETVKRLQQLTNAQDAQIYTRDTYDEFPTQETMHLIRPDHISIIVTCYELEIEQSKQRNTTDINILKAHTQLTFSTLEELEAAVEILINQKIVHPLGIAHLGGKVLYLTSKVNVAQLPKLSIGTPAPEAKVENSEKEREWTDEELHEKRLAMLAASALKLATPPECSEELPNQTLDLFKSLFPDELSKRQSVARYTYEKTHIQLDFLFEDKDKTIAMAIAYLFQYAFNLIYSAIETEENQKINKKLDVYKMHSGIVQEDRGVTFQVAFTVELANKTSGFFTESEKNNRLLFFIRTIFYMATQLQLFNVDIKPNDIHFPIATRGSYLIPLNHHREMMVQLIKSICKEQNINVSTQQKSCNQYLPRITLTMISACLGFFAGGMGGAAVGTALPEVVRETTKFLKNDHQSAVKRKTM